MPPSAQRRLLYLPLFFHEFGHLLYACHKPEMDSLVRYLQQTISQYLEPSAQRDDLHSKREQEWRSLIVETWFEWTHEILGEYYNQYMARHYLTPSSVELR